jgi:subtilisin family serine protease
MVGAVLLAFSGVVLAQQQERTTPSNGATPPTFPTGKIAGQYVVVLEDDVSDPRQKAREHAQRHGAEVLHTYEHALKGYAARLSAERVEDVEADPDVDYVEQDGQMGIAAQTLPWGINKVDADLSSTLAGNGSGAVSNVNAYIIDTGVYKHSDLNVVNHVNFAGGQNDDCNGHGTHVAGSAAARDNTSYVVGITPSAPLTGVKVLNCQGSGTTSGVIKGVDWVTANAKKPAVANMSLGGGKSDSLDTAVKNSAARGIFYAVAAGNNSGNACDKSPARAGAGTNNGIMTVAATDSADKEASFSNYGPCVDIWAPGVSILSTKRGGGTKTMSGTSMASPHGAGGGALYLSRNTAASPSTAEGALKSAATTTVNKSKDGRTIKRENVDPF